MSEDLTKKEIAIPWKIKIQEYQTTLDKWSDIPFAFIKNLLKHLIIISSGLLCFIYLYHPALWDMLLIYCMQAAQNPLQESITETIVVALKDEVNGVITDITKQSLLKVITISVVSSLITASILLGAAYIAHKFGGK
jgi:hypothetical protein